MSQDTIGNSVLSQQVQWRMEHVRKGVWLVRGTGDGGQGTGQSGTRREGGGVGAGDGGRGTGQRRKKELTLCVRVQFSRDCLLEHDCRKDMR